MRTHAGSITYVATSALAPYLRVKLTAGKLVAAGAGDADIGTLERRVLAANDLAAVVPPTVDGAVMMVAAAAISQYALVYGAAGGKVSASSGGVPVGIALEQAGGDGDHIRVLRLPQSNVGVVEAHTANHTVTAAESGKTFTTVGATGTVVFALPPAVVGLRYRFRVGAAQELRIDPDGTETIGLPSTGVQQGAGEYITANADGETLEIECTKAGEWSPMGYSGTWTAEGA